MVNIYLKYAMPMQSNLPTNVVKYFYIFKIEPWEVLKLLLFVIVLSLNQLKIIPLSIPLNIKIK